MSGRLPGGLTVSRMRWPDRRAWWLIGVLLPGVAAWSGEDGATPPVAAAPAAPGDPAAVDWLADGAGDWRIGWARGLRGVLVIEFPDLEQQAQALNRVCALIEWAGASRTRVLDDGALHRLVRAEGENGVSLVEGHDYSNGQLARFFTLAQRQHIHLGAAELRLRALLVDQGLLQPVPGGMEAVGNQALLTVPASGSAAGQITPAFRAAILEHELSHGRYFTDADYRARCERFWQQLLTPRQRSRLTSVLAGMNYDPKDHELMVNEAQAYLFHTPDPFAISAEDAGLDAAALALLRAGFSAGTEAGDGSRASVPPVAPGSADLR